MAYLTRSRAGVVLLMALGFGSTAIAPLMLSAPVTAIVPYSVAQLFPSQPNYANNVMIPAGTRLPVRYDAAEKIVVAPTETVPLTLTLARNIRSSNGQLLIPAGSQINGQLRPVGDGSQFVADTLILRNGSRLRLNAVSDVVTRTQEVQPGVNGDALIKGSAIGAGAATILSGVLGSRRITIGKILAGAGAGALGGLIFGRNKAEVIVIKPNSDLTLTLNSPLALSYQY
ncbi:hypothetical protein [Leptodesmis sp.]|uniref:hypothetical protein n=1 Tax=Leptodesmis sp. TaxID=3100501 RepID=UPI0040535860